jgi:Rho GTPase-activating protein 39
VTAMNKRNSQAMPSPSTPETVPEQPEPAASTPSENSPKSLSSVPERSSRSRPSTGGSKNSTQSNPPSAQRQQNRTSGTPYHASIQQNLDAAAEMVVRSARSNGAIGSRSAPNFGQELARAQTDFPLHLQDAAKRNNMKLRVITDSVGSKQGTRSATDSRSNGTGGVIPSPRRPNPVPEKSRPRRNTTTTVHQISAPINDSNSRHMHLADVGGGPILVTDPMMHTKRLSTGEHRTLPKQLAEEIQKFQVADFAKRYFTTHRTGLIFRRKVPVEQLMSFQKVSHANS